MSSASRHVSGVDRVIANPELLRPGPVGLLTHFAAVTADLGRGVDALSAAGVDVRCLISPEHGYWGSGQAGDGSDADRDPVTGLPILDAYGAQGEALDVMLSSAGIHHLVVDLQDIGCRFYTYMWSMVDAMAACARIGMPVTVLDRPAPLPAVAAGPGLDPELASFVGRLGFPVRHGARIGDIARTVAARHLARDLDLSVIDAPGGDGGAPWIPPSPNMPSRTTVALYPGTGLLEGTTMSEGRGTTAPFEMVGAPWSGPEFAAYLRDLDLPGVAFREAVFHPTHGAFASERVHGVAVHITAELHAAARDLGTFDPLRLGHAIIASAAALYPNQALWREPAPGRPPFIDLLWGSAALREGINDGADYDEILAASPEPLELGA